MDKKTKNKRNIIIFILFLTLTTIIAVNVYFNNREVRNVKNIAVYKRVNYDSLKKTKINLTKKQERKIKKYLNRESLKEREYTLKCMTLGTYTIAFDGLEVQFDNGGDCVTYLLDKKKHKRIQINISSKLKRYVVKIANKGGK